MRIYNGFRVSINPQLPPRTWRLIGPRSLECSADLAKELAGLKQDKAKAACISPYSKKPVCLYLPAEI